MKKDTSGITVDPVSITQSWECDPIGSAFLYLIVWHTNTKYRLRRRPRSAPNKWALCWQIENWVTVNDGSWGTSAKSKPFVIFDTMEEVMQIIKLDILNNPQTPG